MEVPLFKSKPPQMKCGVTRFACRDAPWRVRHPRHILVRRTFAANTDAPRRVPTRGGFDFHLMNCILLADSNKKMSILFCNVLAYSYICSRNMRNRKKDGYGYVLP